MIMDPITFLPITKIADALELMRRYKIPGVPVTKNKKLVGILTNRDLRFETRTDILISKIMTKDKSDHGPSGNYPGRRGEILHEHRVKSCWWWTSKYNLKGLITSRDIQKKLKYPGAAKTSMEDYAWEPPLARQVIIWNARRKWSKPK